MADVFTGPWYPWYPEKALTSEVIDGLTLAEEGAYRRALDKAWLKGSLPKDPKEAARIIGRGCTAKIAAAVLAVPLFKPMPGNRKRVIHTVIERIRAEQKEKHDKRVEAGKKRKELKANENGHSSSNAPAMQQQCHTDKEEKRREEKRKEKKEEAAADAAPSPRTQLWNIGKKMLEDAGEKNPGSLVGKWTRDYGDAAVISALSDTIAKSPADPKSYMFGILNNKKRKSLVGKSDASAPDCSECGDTGQVIEFEDGDWKRPRQIPCPNKCKSMELAA